MIYRPLGQTGLQISLLGYGAWKAGKTVWDGIEEKRSIHAMRLAMDLGVNYFDTAPGYGFGLSEQFLGKALAGRRQEIIVATKVGKRWDKNQKITKDLSKDSILWEIDQSLLRLRTDYIDVIQIHWHDGKTPMDEIMEAFLSAQKAGKVRFFGACNLSLNQLKELQSLEKLTVVQALYNKIDRNTEVFMEQKLPYRTEEEILPFCEKNQISFVPFCPLGRSFLTDRFDHQMPSHRHTYWSGGELEQAWILREKYLKEAQEQGKPMQELSLGWLAKNPRVSSIIVSSTTLEHIRQNVRVIEGFET